MNKLKVVLFITMLALVLTSCSTLSTPAAGNDSEKDKETETVVDQPNTAQPSEEPEELSEQPSEEPSEEPLEEQPSEEPSEEPLEEQPSEDHPSFTYPDAVRGVYVTSHTTSISRFDDLINLLDQTELNSMVIDIKDDHGYISFQPEDTELLEYSKKNIKDPKEIMKRLSEHNIYPIARIVVFKDTVLANKHPELSYLDNGLVWKNRRGEAFVNPFLKEVWEHNVRIAKLAAELGFQEIQFDYVRFPEGFETRDKTLTYSMGEYKDAIPTKFKKLEEEYQAKLKDYTTATTQLKETITKVSSQFENALKNHGSMEQLTTYEDILKNAQIKLTEMENKKPIAPIYQEKDKQTQLRVDAVSDFVAYAKQELEPYNVDVSVDIFGYSATLPEAPGIGQNFSRISSHVDVISSMIYPSHWGNGYFDISVPDIYPYELVDAYAKVENEVLNKLGDKKPISRPWIQDFTAPWLGKGNYKVYGKEDVEAQIKALNENGINEFLLWNAGNRYTPNVDYMPLEK